ncbi:D-aminopeptidase [Bryobacterales bacterium F-183]|nr:D-aminopeptidase [Bryobacterales bacterium F-183]
MKSSKLAVASFFLFSLPMFCQRARDLGIKPGVLPTGRLNAITDVAGVKVGHVTLVEGERIRTGVTAVLPHGGNLFQNKVAGGIHIANAFGKLAGSTQVEELGNIETPIILTNTLSVAEGIAGAVEWTLKQTGNENVMSVNALVGETNDARLNDIRGRHVKVSHVMQAIEAAKTGAVEEGNVGAGTGTIAFGWKGGIGTSSRVLPAALGGFTIGVLVQSNYGGILTIDGVPVGKELGQYYLKQYAEPAPGGSCMIVIATDAPMDARNLKRLASRSILGLGVTGSSTSNGSGEYAIAFSTSNSRDLLANDAMSPLFQAVKEATEEAVYNSMLAAKTSKDVQALPVDRVKQILQRYKPRP